jgi:predicted Rossmann-fold nucleotide-binding protein
MIEFGVIDETDLEGVYFVETAQEAWNIIRDWYSLA